MSKFKQIFSAFMSVAMAANVFATMPFTAFANEDDSRTYTYDDYEVTYDVSNSWGNTEVVSVTLSNTSDTTIENWMLYFEPDGQVYNTVNAQKEETSDGTMYLKNSGYNADVSPESSISFSYMIDDSEVLPEDFILCQTRIEKNDGYDVAVNVEQAWGSSFIGKIVISNNTDKPIESWELMIDTNFTISEISNSWAATVSTIEPYNYLLKGTYTGIIHPNSSVELGFNGIMEGTPEIGDYSLTEVVVSEDIISDAVNAGLLYDDSIDWSELPDSDGDGLPDEYEEEYGCDVMNPDTDGDGLPDGYEIQTIGSDPASTYSLDVTLSDGECDNDLDGLSNYEEYLLGTDPLRADFDFDGLTDGDEVNIYNTDPLNPDSDGDGLSDGDEVTLGLNPLVTDSDEDGITDNKEKFSQNMTYDTEDSDTVIDSINVSFEGTGYINSTTSIKSVMNTDWMCSNVVGLIGEPYDISSDSSFDSATLTFTIDESSLENTELEDLTVLWYNEEEQCFIKMETIPNAEASTITTTVNHFSKYLIVDCDRWYEAWSENNYPNNGKALHTAITIDCSGSMDYNDPECYRVIAANGYVDVMSVADLASVILFSDEASEEQGLTNEKIDLKDAIKEVETYGHGTTNYESALRYSINSLNKQDNSNNEKAIIFLSDGHPTNIVDGVGVEIPDDEFDYSLVDEAAAQGIRIYTIGLTNNVNENILKEMANRTNGEYYYANNAEELISYFLTINMGEKYDIITDTDEDGIPDLFETYGMPVANGQILFSNPKMKDTDGDGLEDGEEVIMHIVNDADEVKSAYNYMYEYIPDIFISENGGIYFTMIANPEKISTMDDGISDFDKLHPEKIFDKYKSEYYSPDCEYYDFYNDSEYYYECLEERYKDRNALKAYTVETLFPELKDETLNSSSNSTYLKVNGNNIEIHVNLMLWDSQYLTTEPSSESDYNYNQPASNVIKDINDNRTLREVFIDGLKCYWDKSFTGSLFDFYPGMEINTEIVINDFTGTDTYHSNGTNHKSRMYAILYSEKGRSYMTINTINIYAVRGMKDFYRSASHEFGHILGLRDYYSDAEHEIPVINDLIYKNSEIRRHGLMNCAYPDLISTTPNDVEMLIYGGLDNSFSTSQSYIPSEEQKISAALREKILYANISSEATDNVINSCIKYEWAEDKYFIPVNSEIKIYNSLKYAANNNCAVIIDVAEGFENIETLEIPSTLDGVNVVKISNNVFEKQKYLKSVTLPNELIEIGHFSFKNCTNLESIILPNSVKKIYKEAFYNCTSLKEIIIPENVERIGNYAFYNCNSLTGITISDGVKNIGNSAFCNCKNIGNVEIPASVEQIEDYAFKNCWYNNAGSITFYRTNNIDGYKSTLLHNDAKVTVYVPSESESLYQKLFANTTKAAILTISE